MRRASAVAAHVVPARRMATQPTHHSHRHAHRPIAIAGPSGGCAAKIGDFFFLTLSCSW